MRSSTAVSTRDREGELLKSATTVGRNASARSGFIPLPLEHVVLEGLANIPVFLRTPVMSAAKEGYQFTLYSTPSIGFVEAHRQRLCDVGVKFIYIRMQNQRQFRQQVEQHLQSVIADESVAITAKSELVYATSVELVDELLVEQDLANKLPRLELIAKSVTSLVINDQSAFSHLLAVSQHDFYTATHMVNVATWMVPLAYACGITSMDELNRLCLAGMVHDIGKIFVSETTLNKPGKLSSHDWLELRAHPLHGYNHLRAFPNIPEMVLDVALEHHERLDGKGYPYGLGGNEIGLASRICAVVDSFDAMTAFRPFKDRTMAFGEAMQMLKEDGGRRYDKNVVEKWLELMLRADTSGTLSGLEENPRIGRREHERYSIDCPVRVHLIQPVGGKIVEGEPLTGTAHNLARCGLGFLTRKPLPVNQFARAYLMGAGTLDGRMIEGIVVRCREFSDGWHEVGLHAASLKAENKAAEASMETK